MAPPALTSVTQLHSDLARTRLLDVRWSLASPDGRAAYLDGHIPGAVYVDLETELAGPGEPTDGRHPLPAIEDLRRAVRRWGIDDGDRVVVYDDAAGYAAARAWWLLRHAGLPEVRLLDGGLAAWRQAGLPVATGQEAPEPGGAVLDGYGSLAVIDIDQAAAFPASGVLLDARAAERYRGEAEPVDPRAGHIPGAVSAPTTGNVTDAQTFLDPAALRARFAALGVTPDRPVAVYCGSGITAAHEVLALAVAGVDAALYPGSWSQWANHPDRPAATGPSPAGDGR